MILFKPKNLVIHFDILISLLLILALFLSLVYPLDGVEANDSFSSKNSQNSTVSIVEASLEEPIKDKMFNSQVPKPDRRLKGVITFYSSTPDQTDSSPFIAADGTRVFDGMIANNCLPFGTQIKIPALYGDKIFTVHDRMNKRFGCAKFDIWMDAPRKELLQLGVKRSEIEVYLVKKPSKQVVVKK